VNQAAVREKGNSKLAAFPLCEQGNGKESRRLEKHLNGRRRKLSYETGSTKKKQKAQHALAADAQGAECESRNAVLCFRLKSELDAGGARLKRHRWVHKTMKNI